MYNDPGQKFITWGSMDTVAILEQLKQERDRLASAINALEGPDASKGAKKRGRKPGRHMSAEGRARIGAAMRKRWAQRKKQAKAA